MPPIPNPHNSYIPQVGDRVRIIGGCHPRCLGKVCEVTAVYCDQDDNRWYYEEKHYCAHPHMKGEVVIGGGLLGGLEPAPGCDIDMF